MQVWDVVPGPRETATIPCRMGVVAVAVPGGAGGFWTYSWCTRPGWGAAGAAGGAAEPRHSWAWRAAMRWGSAAPGQDVLEPAGAETVCPHVLSVRGQQTGPWRIP